MPRSLSSRPGETPPGSDPRNLEESPSGPKVPRANGNDPHRRGPPSRAWRRRRPVHRSSTFEAGRKEQGVRGPRVEPPAGSGSRVVESADRSQAGWRRCAQRSRSTWFSCVRVSRWLPPVEPPEPDQTHPPAPPAPPHSPRMVGSWKRTSSSARRGRHKDHHESDRPPIRFSATSIWCCPVRGNR